jgi:hypothetical protein
VQIKSIQWDGKQITKPGVYSRVPLDIYHGQEILDGPSVSSSILRELFNKSELHAYSQWSGNPARKAEKIKAHFTLGRAVHHLMLGEPNFAQLFCIQPEEYPDKKTGELKAWSGNATFCKEWKASQEAKGRLILTSKDARNIRGMAEAIGQHPIAKEALGGLVERSIFLRDQRTKIWIKSRPDSIPGHSADFIDLKTTTSVQWQDLQRAMGEFGYHQQGALVRRAAREILGMENITFSLVFIEKEEPWAIRVITVKENMLDLGEKQNQAALDRMAACIKSGRWPGPGGDREDAENMELSEWEQKRIEDRLRYNV